MKMTAKQTSMATKPRSGNGRSLSCARAWFHKASSTRSGCVLGDTAREAKSLVESMTDANRQLAIPESSRQSTGRGMWNEESLWPYESKTTKQLETPFYRKTERHDLQVRTHSCESCFPVNPVIRNSNHEQSHIIHGGRNIA